MTYTEAVVGACFALWVLCTVSFRRLYSDWIDRRPLHSVQLLLLVLCIVGVVGKPLGLSNSFWHETWWVQCLGGASVTAFASLLWWMAFDPSNNAETAAAWKGRFWFVRSERRTSSTLSNTDFDDRWHYVRAMYWPFETFLIALAVSLTLTRLARDPAIVGWFTFIWFPLGGLVGIICVFILARDRERQFPLVIAGVVFPLLLLFWAWYPLVTAVMALVAVFAWIAVILELTIGKPFRRIGIAVSFCIAVTFINRNPYRTAYPNMEDVDITAAPLESLNTTQVVNPELTVKVPESMFPRLEDIRTAPDPATASETQLVKELEVLKSQISKDNPGHTLSQLKSKTIALLALQVARSDYAAIARACSDFLDVEDSQIVRRIRAAAYTCQAAAHWTTFERSNPGWLTSSDVREQFAQIHKPLDLAVLDFEKAKELESEPQFADANKWLLNDLPPLLFQALDLRAVNLLRLGERDAALSDMALADRLGQLTPASAITRSLQLEVLGRTKEAIEVLNQAIVTYPNSASLYRQRAQLQRRAGELSSALQDDTESIRLDPTDADTYEHRASLLGQLKRGPEASRDLNRARRLKQRTLAELEPAATASQLPKGVPPLVNDREALEAWHACHGRRAVPLVVVATSGGGITAEYWTASFLARINQACPGFDKHVRIVTGASGGMVGAAVYTLNLHAHLKGRTRNMSLVPDDTAKDSLTPVVRQMLLNDLPGLVRIGVRSNDRGRALEQAWQSNTGVTSTIFASLAAEERAGRLPSLIISPTLVEDARFLLISNLDIPGLGGGAQFYARFPNARARFEIGTALRMNAAFAYVTPGVSLPIDPPRRVIDAGYLDNYGVRLAAAWIDRNWPWLVTHTSGILLVQVRAYPVSDASQVGSTHQFSTAWQFLTTPLEGLSAARLATMLTRNDEAIQRLADVLNDAPPAQPFFRTVVVECDRNTPLGWSLTAGDRAVLDESMERQFAGDAIKAIVDVVKGNP